MTGIFAVIFAAKLVGSVLAVADTGFPQFNPEPGCKAASAINQSIDLTLSQTYDEYIADEESAKQELQRRWSTYSAADKTRCLGQTEDGGMPSFVEVLECIQVTIDVNDSSTPPQ